MLYSKLFAEITLGENYSWECWLNSSGGGGWQSAAATVNSILAADRTHCVAKRIIGMLDFHVAIQCSRLHIKPNQTEQKKSTEKRRRKLCMYETFQCIKYTYKWSESADFIPIVRVMTMIRFHVLKWFSVLFNLKSLYLLAFYFAFERKIISHRVISHFILVSFSFSFSFIVLVI